MERVTKMFAALVCGLVMSAGAASAVTITTDLVPQSGSGWFSSQLSDFNREAENIANDSFDNTAPNNPDDTDTLHTNNPNDTMWLTLTTDTNPFVVIDLGATYTIDSVQIWNYNESGFTNRAVNELAILSTTTAGVGANAPTSFTLQDTFNLTQPTGAGSLGTQAYAGETFVFDQPFTARYIKLDVNSNYGDPNESGLSEVRFNAVVPEPTTLGILAVGAVGLLVRRRRMA